MNVHYTVCAKCGIRDLKRKMRPLYSAISSSMPPRLLCYFCEPCYCNFLEENEIAEKKVCKNTYKGARA